MPFNTNVAPEQGGLAQGLQGFLTAFAHTYAESRAQELKKLQTEQENMGLAQQEIQKYGLGDFQPISTEDIQAGKYEPGEYVQSTYAQRLNVGGFIKKPKEFKGKDVLDILKAAQDNARAEVASMFGGSYNSLSGQIMGIDKIPESEQKIYDATVRNLISSGHSDLVPKVNEGYGTMFPKVKITSKFDSVKPAVMDEQSAINTLVANGFTEEEAKKRIAEAKSKKGKK